MNLFHKRPLLLALFFFLATSVLCAFTTSQIRKIGVFITLLLLLLLLCVIFVRRCLGKHLHRSILNFSICIAFCFTAFYASHSFFDRTLAMLENRSAPATIIAEIKECTYKANYSTVYVAKVEQLNGDRANFSIELSINRECDLERGNRIQTTVSFSPFSESIYGFDERNTNIANGILVSASFSEYAELEDATGSVDAFFFRLRTYLAKRIDSADMDRTAPLVKALLLGETKGLDGMLKQDFRRLGISHILSISGTHFTTLLGMVALLLSMFGLNKRTIYIVLIPLALLYMGLTGFSAAVCRAGIMSILSYWGFLCGRTRDSYTALFVAVTVILLLAPYSVLSIGLWLSFTATFSILIFMDLFSTGRLSAMRASPPGKLLFLLLTHLVITVAVSFFTLLITAACFGEISIAAPFANLLIVPLFELFLYIAPFAAIFSNMGFLTDLTDAIGYHILFLTQRICETDELLLSVNHTFVILIATIGCACTLLLIALPLRRRGWIALPGCLSILCIGISILLYNHVHWKQTNITYFTVGESDGIVVTDQNKTLCIDISNGGSSAAYKAEYIASENHSPELGGYMFTHYHDLHVQQFLKLTNRTNVHTVYLPLSEKADDADKITSISEIAESRNIKVIRFAYGEPVRFADTTIILYAPQDIKRSTHEVIGLKIIAKNQEILYLGSSYYETNFALRDEIKNAAYIFFGQHAPIVKKPFAALTNAFQIYGSATLAAMSDQKRPDIILDKNGQYEIILK